MNRIIKKRDFVSDLFHRKRFPFSKGEGKKKIIINCKSGTSRAPSPTAFMYPHDTSSHGTSRATSPTIIKKEFSVFHRRRQEGVIMNRIIKKRDFVSDLFHRKRFPFSKGEGKKKIMYLTKKTRYPKSNDTSILLLSSLRFMLFALFVYD